MSKPEYIEDILVEWRERAEKAEAALDRAEAEKADAWQIASVEADLKRKFRNETIHLRVELAASQAQYHRNLTALANTHLKALDERDVELAAMREALEFATTFKITNSSDQEVAEDSLHEVRKVARTTLQSHRRTEETT